MRRFAVLGILFFCLCPSLAQAKCDVDIEEGTEVVELATSMGNICMELLRKQAPITVENFLYYLRRGDLDSAFFHRSVPGFVLQGGGFRVVGNKAEQVPPKDTLGTQNEPCTLDMPAPAPAPPGTQICSVRGNERGTVALAKTSLGPNTGTNQWFINLADNRTNLDNQNGGFTVFARVLGDGMTVVDEIAKLSQATADQAYWFSTTYAQVFNQLPIQAEAPLNVGGFGCFNPDNPAVVVDPNNPRAGLPDPLGEAFFFVSGDCGRQIPAGSFVANPGTAKCPDSDRLAVGVVVGPASPLIRGDIQFSLTCKETKKALEQRGLWHADFKRRFIEKLVFLPFFHGKLLGAQTTLKITKLFKQHKETENFTLFLFRDGTFLLEKSDGASYQGVWADPKGKGKKFFLTMDNPSQARLLLGLSELSSALAAPVAVEVSMDINKPAKMILSLNKKGVGTLSAVFNLLGDDGGPKLRKGSFTIMGKGAHGF